MQTLRTHLKTASGGYLDAEPELLLSGHAVHEGLPVLEAVLDEVDEEGEGQHDGPTGRQIDRTFRYFRFKELLTF